MDRYGAAGCKECAGIISGNGLTEKMEKERGMRIQISRREGGREGERKREGVLMRRDVLSFQWHDSVAVCRGCSSQRDRSLLNH
jgi:hypothetical protein